MAEGTSTDILACTPEQAPWRKLPSEIISAILLSVLENSSEDNDEYPAPTTISLVCREWREIALGTPRLWASVRIRGEHGLAIASLWLERAKYAPVTIQCSFMLLPSEVVLNALDLVVRHLHHTVELDIEPFDDEEYDLVISSLSKPAPILQVLRIRSVTEDDDYWVVNDATARSLFAGESPLNLRSLSIVSPCSQWPQGLFPHLTELDLTALGDTDTTRTLRLLESAPHVATLKLQVFGQEWRSNDMVITLPALRYLTINGWINQIYYALNHFDLPGLYSLSVDYDVPSDIELLGEIGTLSITHPQLSTPMEFISLEILRCPSGGEGQNIYPYLPHILQKCRQVKTLSIGGCFFPITRFIDGTKASEWGARLENLIIDYDYRYGDRPQGWVNDDYVASFMIHKILEERRQTLETVTFNGCSPIEPLLLAEYIQNVKKHVSYNGVLVSLVS